MWLYIQGDRQSAHPQTAPHHLRSLHLTFNSATSPFWRPKAHHASQILHLPVNREKSQFRVRRWQRPHALQSCHRLPQGGLGPPALKHIPGAVSAELAGNRKRPEHQRGLLPSCCFTRTTQSVKRLCFALQINEEPEGVFLTVNSWHFFRLLSKQREHCQSSLALLRTV